MTQVIFDVVDLVGEVHPGDTVSVWPPYVASTVDGRVRSTRKIDLLVDEGPVTEDIEPGPMVVQLQCKGIADTKPRTVTIPDEGTVTLANLLQSTFTYTPAVVSQVSLDAQRAEDARDEAVGAADRVGTAEQVGQWAAAAEAEADRAEAAADSIDLDVLPAGNTVPLRDDAGRLLSADPGTDPQHVSTKAYTDSGVAAAKSHAEDFTDQAIIAHTTATEASGVAWYAILRGGMVTLVINAAQANFTLPAAFRPWKNVHMPLAMLDGTTQRTIVNATNGTVTLPVPGQNHYGTATYHAA